ncbi:MAG: non-canonical purine NTP pyrophosphatase, partial [Acidimicrobiia bacterium]
CSEREARFRTVVALGFSDGVEILAEGTLEGRIGHEPRGAGGFGYDPIFEVEGKTLAEMTTDEKNSLSHRARAVAALVEALGL